MKTPRIHNLILSMFLTMSACLSHAGDGGSDTGAGNVVGSYGVSEEQIVDLIKRAKKTAKFVLFGLESSYAVPTNSAYSNAEISLQKNYFIHLKRYTMLWKKHS